MKYAQVIVSIPTRQIDRPFDYKVPTSLEDQVQLGSKVKVPFGSKILEGYVVGLASRPTVELERIKEIEGPVKGAHPIPLELLKLATWMASFYQCLYLDALRLVLPSWTEIAPRTEEVASLCEKISPQELAQFSRAPKQAAILEILTQKGTVATQKLLELADCTYQPLRSLVEKGKVQLKEIPKRRQAMAGLIEHGQRPALTAQQQEAIEKLSQLPPGAVGLLWGITGSGKTEVYLNLIERKLAKAETAIVLVPEIALTPQMVARFRSRFGEQVAVLHSQLNTGERKDEWERVRQGEASVVLGPRSALFAHTARLGLIIIDEEHEPSYKQESPPRYHAREVAIHRAGLCGAQVVLGSATPSLESFRQATEGSFELVTLSTRPTGQELPQVQVVDMRQELLEGNRSMFSRLFQEELRATLQKGEQAILFLNRRGYSTTVLCRECGQSVRCPNCEIPLTFHFGQQELKCHYCGFHRLSPKTCPECGSPKIRHFGTGTEKIEAELKRLYPGVRLSRMDVDTTKQRGSHTRILDAFRKGKTQLLVGTQMVAKGLDFPNVTLVGVVMADLTLNLPDFRAAERTFQLLTQVAGRAGRGDRPGKVIIQSYLPEHYSIQAAKEHDYLGFYKKELPYRKRQGYPPFVRLVNITIVGPEEGVVRRVAKELALKLEGNIIGPVPAPFAVLRGKWRYRIMARFLPEETIPGGWLSALTSLNYTSSGVKISVDVDPISML